jgi:glucose-6-phosphate isomerase, archaeal
MMGRYTPVMKGFWTGDLPKPAERTIGDMRSVLAEPDCTVGDRTLYRMYRDLAMTPEDRAWLRAHDLRYDMTAIEPGTICGEYIKTKGHYHPENPAGVRYPELYQVISGTAHFLFQKRDVSDIVVSLVRKGEVVLVPPEYGHVTINPASDPLVIANIVSSRFTSEYGDYESLGGAAYYELEGGRWVKNPRYGAVPDLRHVDPPEIPDLCLRHGPSIYTLIGREECLRYLNEPEDYQEVMSPR